MPERNQRISKGEGPNMTLARKHTNAIITLPNHVHAVAKHLMPETGAQPKTLCATAAKRKDTLVHSAEPNQFLVFQRTQVF